MSGGHFDYNQYHLNDMADEIEKLIASNNKADEYGYVRNYTSHVIDEFKQAIKALKRARTYVQRIDWLVSGDDSEESFQRQLSKELGEIH